jgi:hypothetical protein
MYYLDDILAWNGRAMATVLSYRHEIHPRSVHVGFVVGKVAPWQDIFRVLPFTPVTTPPMLHTSSSTRLVLQERQMSEPGEHSKMQRFFSEIWDRWSEKYFHCTSYLKWIAQEGICWSLTTQTRVRSWATPREICGGKRGVRTGSSPSNQTVSCHFHFTSVPYPFVRHRICRNPTTDTLNISGGTVDWSNALQAEKSRVIFLTQLSAFFIDLILPVALWPWGGLSL